MRTRTVKSVGTPCQLTRTRQLDDTVSMVIESSARQRKREQTRDRLHQAALRLFDTRGYDATTVDDVAGAAGVSRRTFFRYFESKEAVVFAQQPRRMALFRKLVDRGSGGWPVVRAACLDLLPDFEAAAEDGVLMHRIIKENPALQAADRARDREWEDLIAEALVRGATSADPSFAAVQAGAIVGALRTVIRSTRAEGAELSLLVIRALDALESGIAGPP